MRVSDALLLLIIKNGGRLPGSVVNEMGVLRLALDLWEARKSIENTDLVIELTNVKG
jgi:hypothetical protein